ncbi:MAG: 2-oxo acid dehydrogenase subunit E2 [Actinomycetota bacterium]|nr:2-oxo acid dehydrogenase subunit E2 [Actinomycetota bacterium]
MPDITMPQLGETVTEGTITKWFKQVGDEVNEDEPLFEVSTDKVDSEVPSTASGYLAEILVEEGETVDVGAKLAVITADKPSGGDGDGGSEADDGEAAKQAPQGKAADDGEEDGQRAEEESVEKDDADEPPSVDEQEEPVSEDAETRPPRAEAEASKARQQAKEDGGAEGRASSDGDGGDGGGAGRGEGGGGKRTAGKLLSPVVRKLINENNLDPDQIEGSGQGGRITRADVLAYIDRNGGRKQARQPAAAATAPPDLLRREDKPEGPAEAPADGDGAEAKAPSKQPAPAAAAKRPAPMAPAAAGADDEVIPFSNIRRRTAEHMIRSKATSAHVLVATEVDYHAVDKVRKAVKNEFKEKEGFSLTYLPFIARAVIDAMEEFPHVNASVGDNELIVHRRINLGVAVDINFEGLIVPVVHDADQLRLRALARSMADLARRARSRELSADDISGGTFTITNPGPFGTFLTYAVINQPQVAILSTDGIRKRPVAIELPDGTDAVVVRPVGMLGLSFDHRAFDGAYASAFVGRVKEIIETRDWSQEV